MKTKFTVLSVVIIPLLLLGIVGKGLAQTIDVSKTVSNITTGGNGNNASQNDVLQYTIVVNNLYYYNFTGARLYDNIPAGTAYVAGTTTLNGSTLADVSGAMPFVGAGALIKSPSASTAGLLIPNLPAVVRFRVKVTANGGNITNYALLEYSNAGTAAAQNTNTVFTNLKPDSICSIIYQATGTSASGGAPRVQIKVLNTTNGKAGAMVFDGSSSGGPCFNAITGASLSKGTVLTNTAAIAYEKVSNRIYFVNNETGSGDHDLSYIDMNTSPVSAKRFVGYPLNNGTAINRMSFCSDGFGYGLTSNGDELVRFSVNALTNVPTITSLGALTNDINNGSFDIRSETGGDIFGDGSGNLYLISNDSRLYKINPKSPTLVSTYLGGLNPKPTGGSSNSLAIDAAGNVYVGGAYQNVFTVNLSSMAASSITGGSSSNVWTNGDYASCGFPVLAPALVANKTWRNANGLPEVVGGDTVEYVIEVINTGNLNAAGVKLYDYIPAGTEYVPNSTKLNNIAVADNAGNIMPFSVIGGQEINSTGETNGIIRPGTAYKVVMTFKVKTLPDTYVCNQSKVTLYDINNNVIFVNSVDPTSSDGSGTGATCFYAFGVLPDDNLTFKASLLDQQSVTQWSIKNEYNISHFEVEYSPDGVTFVQVGRLSSKGNIQGVNNYQFTDPGNLTATNRYYRLKIFSTKGTSKYSFVLRLNTGSMQVTRIQPNPFDKFINLQLSMKSADKLDIRLIDMYGRIVYRSHEQLSKGAHSMSITVPKGLTKGAYIIQLIAGTDQLFQQKLIKQ